MQAPAPLDRFVIAIIVVGGQTSVGSRLRLTSLAAGRPARAFIAPN
jgi:hypothetical protein